MNLEFELRMAVPDVCRESSQFARPGYPAVRRVNWAFCGLLVITCGVRMIGIDRPLVGHFATKSTVYAMIARNWAEGRANAWYPTLDVMRNGQPSLHMVEFPVSAYLAGGAWRIGGGSLDVWGRGTAVGFSVASVALLYWLVRRWHSATAALGAAVLLAFSPVSVIYGQSFMLEASVVFFSLATVAAMDCWLERRSAMWMAIAATVFGLAVLTKIYMLVLLAPLAFMAWRSARTHGRTWTLRDMAGLSLIGLIAILPAAAWYADAYRSADLENPISERLFYSIRQSATVHGLPHPILRNPDFYRQLVDDLVGPALTPLGFALVLVGLLHQGCRRHAAWLASMGMLVMLLPLKFFEMQYYHLVILPPLCVLGGLGWELVVQGLRPSRAAVVTFLAIGAVLSARYTLKPAFETPEEDRGVLAAAEAVRSLTTDGEPIATTHGSTIDLLYYSDRRGYALASGDPTLSDQLSEAAGQGARYWVVAGLEPAFEEAPLVDAAQDLELVRSGEGFRVYRLSATAITSRARSMAAGSVSTTR